jgi:U32 family peptidase
LRDFKSKFKSKSKILLATPRILKPGETGYLKLIERAARRLLLRNLAALQYYKDRSDLIKAGDFSLNVANPITARLLMENAGLDYLTVSYDLNIGQVLDLLEARRRSGSSSRCTSTCRCFTWSTACSACS